MLFTAIAFYPAARTAPPEIAGLTLEETILVLNGFAAGEGIPVAETKCVSHQRRECRRGSAGQQTFETYFLAVFGMKTVIKYFSL
jgi:hypothetical protein